MDSTFKPSFRGLPGLLRTYTTNEYRHTHTKPARNAECLYLGKRTASIQGCGCVTTGIRPDQGTTDPSTVGLGVQQVRVSKSRGRPHLLEARCGQQQTLVTIVQQSKRHS